MEDSQLFKIDRKVYSDQLLKLTKHCPDCNTLMHATGMMYLEQNSSWWYIEYWCPKDKQQIPVYSRETQRSAEAIVQEIGAADGASSS